MADSPLRAFGEDLFYVEDTVRFYGVPIQTRMVVARLDGDALWVCSPLPITDEIAHALDAMGRVAHIVSPNKIHNQGLDSFHTRYPDAKLWASPGLPARRPELEYEAVLGDPFERVHKHKRGSTHRARGENARWVAPSRPGQRRVNFEGSLLLP